jgi:hypothetical protein
MVGDMVESALVAALVDRGGRGAAACLRMLVYGEELPARGMGLDVRFATESDAQAF